MFTVSCKSFLLFGKSLWTWSHANSLTANSDSSKQLIPQRLTCHGLFKWKALQHAQYGATTTRGTIGGKFVGGIQKEFHATGDLCRIHPLPSWESRWIGTLLSNIHKYYTNIIYIYISNYICITSFLAVNHLACWMVASLNALQIVTVV